MKLIFSNIFFVSSSEMRKAFAEVKLSVFLLFCLSALLFTACAPKVSFQIERPPLQLVANINYIEVGNFQTASGQIKFPSDATSESKRIFSGTENILKPAISEFNSTNEQGHLTADLLRAALLHELSLQSPYQLINTTGKEAGFSVALPDQSEIAVLHGKVKYAEIIIESEEGLSYFTNVKNKGATLEQSLLAGVVSMGAESSGTGFVIATPYVEQIAALEVEFSLLRKNDNREVVPSQSFRTYFVRKWGGSVVTSHLPLKIKDSIINNYQSDEDSSESLLSIIDRAGLSFTNPTEYFARGFNLRNNAKVPQTTLELKIRLGRQVARQYVKQISPYQERAELLVQDGNSVAVNLIRGNAYQEAVAFLLALNERTAEDEHNLGLAFEAAGEISQARKHYETALKMDSNNPVFKAALTRTIN
jgi:tetratricopeptide (TPR) repeat protein